VDEVNEDLVARVRQRDVAALAKYVEVHRRQLLAFIERQLHVSSLRWICDPGRA